VESAKKKRKQELRKEESGKLSRVCQEQVMWAGKMECVLFYGFLVVYFNNVCNITATICKQCFYPFVIWELFKISGDLNGMYDVFDASSCRPAKNHSVMSQNVLDGLNHSFTTCTLINSLFWLTYVLNFFKTKNRDTICRWPGWGADDKIFNPYT